MSKEILTRENFDKFKKEQTPIDLLLYIKSRNGIANNITYDKSVNENFEYRIIRGCGGDGCLVYAENTLNGVCNTLISSSSFYKKTEPENWEEIAYIQYTIGDLKHEMAGGNVKLMAGVYPGIIEKFTLPVRCEYIKKTADNANIGNKLIIPDNSAVAPTIDDSEIVSFPVGGGYAHSFNSQTSITAVISSGSNKDVYADVDSVVNINSYSDCS